MPKVKWIKKIPLVSNLEGLIRTPNIVLFRVNTKQTSLKCYFLTIKYIFTVNNLLKFSCSVSIILTFLQNVKEKKESFTSSFYAIASLISSISSIS